MLVREAPASIGQRVLWQMEHHRGANGALNCPLAMTLDGPLDTAALAAALTALTRRHEALRTTFAGRGPRLVQRIHAHPPPLPLDPVELAGDDTLEHALAAEVARPSDLEQAPVRAAVWRLSPTRHVLCLTMHHLVTDGWSTALVGDELTRLYAHVRAGGPAPAPVVWQFERWARWQREQLGGERLRELQRYWSERLRGAALPRLPRRGDVPLDERRTGVERRLLGGTLAAALRAYARERRAAFFSVVLAVFSALLSDAAPDGDLTLGSVFANRMRPETRATVGFLSNMVVLRVRCGPRATFEQLVAAADEAVIGAFAHQELPFQMLPLGTLDSASMRPDALVLQLLDGPLRRTVAAGVTFAPIVDVPAGIGSRWELELSLAPEGDDLALLLSYAREVYEPRWACELADAYGPLAAALLAAPRAPIAARAV